MSDNSSDSTDDIVKEYAEQIPYLSLVRYNNPEMFTSELGRISKKVVACVKEGMKHLTIKDYEYIGILDADVSFDADMMSNLLKKFTADKQLGLAGGYIYNTDGSKQWPYFTKSDQVGGPLQLFRKECWDDIGGYYPGGHHDYYAVVSGRMHGWHVKSFEDLKILHLKKNISTTGKNHYKASFYLGRMDYICGEVFLYSFLRSISQLNKKPKILGGLLRISGYLFSLLTRTPKQIPYNLQGYLKKEQLEKIFARFDTRKRKILAKRDY